MRKFNIDIKGYSDLISPKILKRIGNQTHTMGKMPYYNQVDAPVKLYEEKLVETRYKELCDSYARTYGVTVDNIDPMMLFLNFSAAGMKMCMMEVPHRSVLIKLAEKIVREQFNLSEDEVIFDLELVDPGECQFPPETDKKKEVEEDFEQSTDLDVLKKRTINALSQGSSLKSHYIFHLYRNEIEELIPGISELYQKALIGNDLFYFIMDDQALCDALADEDDGANAGYVKLNFDGDVPVIEAKAIAFPLLIHEMTKGVITLLSIPGIQNMDPAVVDETDFVMSELWEIRFGATLWELFHGTIDFDDYEYKKLIIMELFKFESDEFLDFMKDVVSNPEKAKTEVKRIARSIKNKIYDYESERD